MVAEQQRSRAYAAAVSTPTSWEKIRDAASPGQGDKPAKTTTIPFIDVLSQLRILDELPAWTPSRHHLDRLTQAPKHHLMDPALAARLVGITRASLLTGVGQAFTPNDVKQLLWLREQLGDQVVDAAVLTTGEHAYRRRDGIAVVPLGLLGP